MPNSELGQITREDGDTCAVRLERELAAETEDVWAAITDPDELKHWLAPTELDARVGGEVKIDFEKAQQNGSIVRGTVRICDPSRTLEYDWDEGGDTRSVLRLELEPTEEGTRIILTHRLLNEDEVPGFAAGWHAHLEALRDVLGGMRAHPEWVKTMKARYTELRPLYAEKLATAR